MRQTLALFPILALTLFGCSPVDEIPAAGAFGPEVRVTHLNKPHEVELDSIPLLRQEVGAPLIESYEVVFTVTRGHSREIELKYEDEEGELEDFLDLEFGEDTLQQWPDGTPIQDGESVEITLTVAPFAFQFTLSPPGLVFSANDPLRIEVDYEHADPDFNHDGVVDALDDAIREQLGWWREDVPGWVALETMHDLEERTLRSHTDILENIAVSW
jgi:hypothetical protein